jgi:hypothetical protein
MTLMREQTPESHFSMAEQTGKPRVALSVIVVIHDPRRSAPWSSAGVYLADWNRVSPGEISRIYFLEER